MVTLYQGGQYNLYRYKNTPTCVWSSRPNLKLRFWAATPTTLNIPRYDLDMALFRVYENDQPIHVDNYFKWSTRGAKDGELVFVSGHPGRTERMDTVAHLEYLRDFGYPVVTEIP